MNDKPELTTSDKQLLHTIHEHLVLDAFDGLIVAAEELKQVDEERFRVLLDKVNTMIAELEGAVDEALDSIPGVLSKDEANNLLRETLESLALLQSMPAETFLPDPEVLH